MTAPVRHVLLVAYHFPPMGGSGVQRPAKFAAALPRCGWRPVVLCAGHSRYPLQDRLQGVELPAAVHVERHLGWEPAALAERARRALSGRAAAGSRLEQWERRLYWRLDRCWPRGWLPEAEWLWSLSAVRAARRLVRQFRIDAVITSGGPFSVHRIGAALKRRLKLPWVAEFRDPLIGNFGYRPASARVDAYWRRLERATVQLADRIVVTCDECGDHLRRRHPALDARRLITITNGFDPADFAALHRADRVAEVGRGGGGEAPANWELAHVGALYRGQSIAPVLQAFRSWLERRPELLGRVRLRLVGSVSAEQRQFIRASDERFLRDDGYQSHRAAAAAMRRADALLLMVPAEAGGRLCIPAKTFEYLASGRPIVAAVHADTSLERLLSEAGGVAFVRNREPAGFAAALDEAYERFGRRGEAAASREALLRGFTRDSLTERLAVVLNGCIGAEIDSASVAAPDSSGCESRAAGHHSSHRRPPHQHHGAQHRHREARLGNDARTIVPAFDARQALSEAEAACV